MSVYVDDMRANFRGMIMCHMIADSHDELVTFAAKLGLSLKWIQHPNSSQEHFDIALSKRRVALSLGAIDITWRQAGAMTHRRMATGELGDPATAERWLGDHMQKRRDTV